MSFRSSSSSSSFVVPFFPSSSGTSCPPLLSSSVFIFFVVGLLLGNSKWYRFLACRLYRRVWGGLLRKKKKKKRKKKNHWSKEVVSIPVHGVVSSMYITRFFFLSLSLLHNRKKQKKGLLETTNFGDDGLCIWKKNPISSPLDCTSSFFLSFFSSCSFLAQFSLLWWVSFREEFYGA